MEQILLNIMRRLADSMTDVSLIDEDYGQLETDEDTYPVTFPCLLVGNMAVDWTDTTSLCQKGSALFTVRLAIDCYHDTYIGSSQEDMMVTRQAMAQRVYKALQGFRPTGDTGRISRRKSLQFAIRGGIKLYEITFALPMHDDSAD